MRGGKQLKIFSMDNPVFNAISRLGDMFILSFLWVIASLPVFTVGAATTAAYDCAFKILRARDSSVFKDFIRSFRSNLKQATALFFIMLPIGAVIAADLYYWAQSEGELAFVMNSLSIGIAALYLITLLFVFPVQAVFENPVKKTLQTAFFMALNNWPTSLLLLVISVGLSYLCYILPIAGYIFLIVGNGFMTMIYAIRFLVIFRKYNPALNPEIPEECDIEPVEKPVKKDKVKIKISRKNKIIK